MHETPGFVKSLFADSLLCSPLLDKLAQVVVALQHRPPREKLSRHGAVSGACRTGAPGYHGDGTREGDSMEGFMLQSAQTVLSAHALLTLQHADLQGTTT